LTDDGKRRVATLAKLREAWQSKPPADVAEELARSGDEFERRLGVNALAAMDELSRLALVMTTTKHADVWDHGVLALRHWIGRGPGQDQKLYKALTEKGGFSPGEAEVVLNLLHSYGADDLARPETYEALIDYLESDRLPIRGLAEWHLTRLVPAGKKIGYNPVGPKEEREAAVKEWRKLIPSGKLPPRTKTGDN
jgi:hypothetical protein